MIKKIAILIAIAILVNGLLWVYIWAHRVLVMGLNPVLGSLELLLFMAAAIVSITFGVKKLSKHVRLREWFSPATAFFLGFLILLFGNLFNNLVYGSSTLDIQLHDTYFVIAHAHLMGVFALIFFAFFTVYWGYPRITGKTMNAPLSYFHFVVTLSAFFVLAWQAGYMDLTGMPRRYLDYSGWSREEQINNFKVGVMVALLFAQVIFVANLVYSALKSRK